MECGFSREKISARALHIINSVVYMYRNVYIPSSPFIVELVEYIS